MATTAKIARDEKLDKARAAQTPKLRDVFMQYHADLADPRYWIEKQERVRAGIQEDVFPYPETIRFTRRFAR